MALIPLETEIGLRTCT